ATAFVVVQLAVSGYYLGACFAPNHIGMPLHAARAEIDFLRRQVLVSRNIRGGHLVSTIMGGLNYQIEHHLFPAMPAPNLHRAAPVVRAFCEAHGIRYTQVGAGAAYGAVVRHLNDVGLAGNEFACPLVTQYRPPT